MIDLVFSFQVEGGGGCGLSVPSLHTKVDKKKHCELLMPSQRECLMHGHDTVI